MRRGAKKKGRRHAGEKISTFFPSPALRRPPPPTQFCPSCCEQASERETERQSRVERNLPPLHLNEKKELQPSFFVFFLLFPSTPQLFIEFCFFFFFLSFLCECMCVFLCECMCVFSNNQKINSGKRRERFEEEEEEEVK